MVCEEPTARLGGIQTQEMCRVRFQLVLRWFHNNLRQGCDVLENIGNFHGKSQLMMYLITWALLSTVWAGEPILGSKNTCLVLVGENSSLLVLVVEVEISLEVEIGIGLGAVGDQVGRIGLEERFGHSNRHLPWSLNGVGWIE